jgi:hypothetical protein
MTSRSALIQPADPIFLVRQITRRVSAALRLGAVLARSSSWPGVAFSPLSSGLSGRLSVLLSRCSGRDKFGMGLAPTSRSHIQVKLKAEAFS